MRKDHAVKRESAILTFGVALAVVVAGFQLVPSGSQTLTSSSSTPATSIAPSATAKASASQQPISIPKVSVSSGDDD